MSDKEISLADKYQQLVNEHEYLKNQFNDAIKTKYHLIRDNNELNTEVVFLRKQIEVLTVSLKSINSLVEILTETEKE